MCRGGLWYKFWKINMWAKHEQQRAHYIRVNKKMERIRLPLANTWSISKKGNTVTCATAKYSLLPPLPSPFHAGIWTVENWVSLVTRILSYTHLNQQLCNIFKSFRWSLQLVQGSANVLIYSFYSYRIRLFTLIIVTFFAVLESKHAFR